MSKKSMINPFLIRRMEGPINKEPMYKLGVYKPKGSKKSQRSGEMKHFSSQSENIKSIKEKDKFGYFVTIEEMFPNLIDRNGDKIILHEPSDIRLNFELVLRELKSINQSIVDSEDRNESLRLQKRERYLKCYKKIILEALKDWKDYKKIREDVFRNRKPTTPNSTTSSSGRTSITEKIRFDEEYHRFRKRQKDKFSLPNVQYMMSVDRINSEEVINQVLIKDDEENPNIDVARSEPRISNKNISAIKKEDSEKLNRFRKRAASLPPIIPGKEQTIEKLEWEVRRWKERVMAPKRQLKAQRRWPIMLQLLLRKNRSLVKTIEERTKRMSIDIVNEVQFLQKSISFVPQKSSEISPRTVISIDDRIKKEDAAVFLTNFDDPLPKNSEQKSSQSFGKGLLKKSINSFDQIEETFISIKSSGSSASSKLKIDEKNLKGESNLSITSLTPSSPSPSVVRLFFPFGEDGNQKNSELSKIESSEIGKKGGNLAYSRYKNVSQNSSSSEEESEGEFSGESSSDEEEEVDEDLEDEEEKKLVSDVSSIRSIPKNDIIGNSTSRSRGISDSPIYDGKFDISKQLLERKNRGKLENQESFSEFNFSNIQDTISSSYSKKEKKNELLSFDTEDDVVIVTPEMDGPDKKIYVDSKTSEDEDSPVFHASPFVGVGSKYFKDIVRQFGKQLEEYENQHPSTPSLDDSRNSRILQNPRFSPRDVKKNEKMNCAVEIEEEIAGGNYGVVYKGRMKVNIYRNAETLSFANYDLPIAIKRINVKKKSHLEQNFVKIEIEILKRLKHMNLVRYYGSKYSQSESEYWILMEYMDCGSLENLIEKRKKKKRKTCFDEKEIQILTFSILSGLQYLHKKKIIHRDLKPSNILFNSKGELKISDFGVSTIVVGDSLRKSCVGTPFFCSIEILKGEEYSYKADIWSLGIIVLYLILGDSPWKGTNNILNFTQVVMRWDTVLFLKNLRNKISDKCINFLESCFVKNWKKRKSAEELINHKWLENIQHSTILKDSLKIIQ